MSTTLSAPAAFQIRGRSLSPVGLALTGSVLLTLGSFGAGAIRYRGGVLDALGLGFLAYGHGQGLSNAVFAVGLLLTILTWVLLGRWLHQSGRTAEIRLRTVRNVLIATVSPLLLAAPMMSRDVYSYLMQGAMLRDGFDPYTEGAAVNPGPMLLEVSHDWRNTTTPYGPLHLWIGDVITSIVGDNVTLGVLCYKVVSVIGFIAIAYGVSGIAGYFNSDRALALWIGVANPVMVIHMIGGMHNESIMVGLVSVGILLVLRRRFMAGVALIAVATALKATAAIALPFMVWIGMHQLAAILVARRSRTRPGTGQYLIAFVISGGLAVLVTAVVVSLITWASGASWGWVSELTGNSKVINPLAFPSLIAGLISMVAQLFTSDFNYNAVLAVLRSVSMVIMLAGLVTTWWLFRKSPRRAVMGTVAAYGVAFVFNSVTLPWYYASMISLVGTFRPPARLMKFITAASVFIALAFTSSGNHQLYNIPWVLVTALIAWGAVQTVFPKNPAPALD
ncbi:alpha-(1-_6)-mannopyranosyltransferase A [Corynebacterium pacaense]|uniref:alpha-(1->6)-mannopyranosyltransferase A n=1 Tax=Corynebacterium pacaense TaxID=1816684 RepID=UPI0009BB233A|nr:alpha-(1->6)-mannopyranosyltransferase A [Corynebacterium pacaense]